MLVAPVVVVLRSYLVKGQDLLTTKNLFVIGVSNFMGVAGLTTGVRQLYRGNQQPSDLLVLFAGVALLFASFWWAYNRWTLPQRISPKLWKRSPPANLGTITLIGSLAGVLGLFASVLPIEIPVVGQIIDNLGKLLPAAAVAVFLFAWLRNPIMLMYLGMAVGAFAIAVFTALFGSGRHPLFAAIMSIPVAWYWGRWRYLHPVVTTGRMTGIGVGVVLVILVYSGFRHDVSGDGDSGVAMERVRQLLEFRLGSGGIIDDYLQEDAITVALLCIEEFHRNGSPDYFHTVRYVLANPIPRDWWPDKPEALGEFLPRDRGEWVDGKVNWGPSIIGNAIHDGGLFMTVIYGLILGGVFRICDDILASQPHNPWPVMLLAAATPKLVALSRGDITIYIVALLGIVIVGVLTLRAAMLVFGSVEAEEFADHPDGDEEDDVVDGEVAGLER